MRFQFIVSETWTSLKRNMAMIISVMLVTFISFVFIGASVLMQTQVQQAKGDWYDQVEVVVWLCPDGTSDSANCSTGKAPTNDEIVKIEDTIQNELSDIVAKTTYVSRQQFYKNTFLKEYPGGVYQGRTLTAADMQASLRLKLTDADKYKEVSEVLGSVTGVESVEDQREIFEPVFAVLNRATAVTVVLAAVMVLVAILLTGTTIRMSAASRKNETEIMRLVGASNWTIRLPFILEGAVAALIGSILACVALGAVVEFFITRWVAQSISWMSFINVRTVLIVSPALIIGAILLSVLASAISLRRYLKA